MYGAVDVNGADTSLVFGWEVDLALVDYSDKYKLTVEGFM